MTKSPSSAASSPPCGTTTERSAGLICNLLPAFATCFLGSLTSRFQHNCIIYIETPRPFRPRGFGFLSANGKSQQMAHSKSRKTFSPLVSNATCESPPLRTADLTKRVQYPLAKTLLFYRQNTHVCFILSAILICATMLCEKTFLPFRLLPEDACQLDLCYHALREDFFAFPSFARRRLSTFFPQMEFPALFLSKLHLPADFPASVGVFSIYNYHLRFHLDILNSIRRFTRANILFLTLF